MRDGRGGMRIVIGLVDPRARGEIPKINIYEDKKEKKTSGCWGPFLK